MKSINVAAEVVTGFHGILHVSANIGIGPADGQRKMQQIARELTTALMVRA